MPALARHALAMFASLAVVLAGSACGGSKGTIADAGAETAGDSGCATGACVPRVAAMAAGDEYTCALLSDGTVECWGDNYFGQLGDGTSSGPQACTEPEPCSMTPVAVSGLTGVTAIAAGWAHACALLQGGTVECWGDNLSGELGDGTGAQTQTAPVAVSGLGGVTALAAGYQHTCALLSGGTVECWGDNSSGELGDGKSTGPETCSSAPSVPCSTTPVAVSGLSGVTAIAAGYRHTCALLSGGTVECWGDDSSGELGDGTSTGVETCPGSSACSTTPVAVSGSSGVIAMAAGDATTCALLSGGTVACWGDNEYGQLADGTSTGPQTCGTGPTGACSATPVAVAGVSGVTAMAAGGGWTCALLSGGTVECWGINEYGELGNGTNKGPETCSDNACSTTPVAVSGL
jgi:alpha-tubulin suppressor-like RCC1 family protein